MVLTKEVIKEYISEFVQAFLIFIVMYLIFWPVKIDGSSMEPELFHGDRVIMSRIMAPFAERGDLVICKNPSPNGKGNVVKRIVGLPGDYVTIDNKELYINGQLISEPYAIGDTFGTVEIALANDEYFLLGDNREVSVDSRNYGCVKRKAVKGKIILRWFPVNKIKKY